MKSIVVKLSVIAIAAIVLTRCGKNNAPLTEQQQAVMKEITTSTSQVVSSAKSAESRKNGSSALATANAAGESELSKKLSEANCQFETPAAPESTSQLSSISLKVQGDQCPIKMDIGIRGSETNAEFKMYFEITDPEVQKLSDVTKVDIGGVISGSEQSASGTISGSIFSKKYGEIKISIVMNFSPAGSTMEMTYSFADFVASMKIEQNEDGVTYSVNGQKVEEAEFNELNGGGGFLGTNTEPTQEEGTITTQTNDTSLSYELSENGCTTGKLTFPSPELLCEALKDDGLNNNCAKDLRRLKFQSSHCQGDFDLP